jgi:hypothetical protein
MNARLRLVLPLAGLVLAVWVTGCEKSNEQVLQDQLREGGAACQAGCETPPTGCRIKGNIGPGGKFFILPGDRRYAAAIIDPAKGERWFCLQADAEANGFKAVPN